jgi:hypothetical protein
VIADPVARGRALADFHATVAPALWHDLIDSGLVAGGDSPRARDEWECLAAFGCARGLVAAGGFGSDSRAAVDALFAAVVERWAAAPVTGEPLEERRARLADRTAEYAALGQAAGSPPSHGRPSIGDAAARRICATDIAGAELGVMLGELLQAIVEGAAERVREDGAPA